jgi:hypothetical protein
MKAKFVLFFALMVSVGMLGACGHKKVAMTAASTVPAATGHAEIGTDRNGNTTIDLKVQHLAKPENLTPAASTYVVWIQPRGGAPQNQGALQVNSDLNGEYKGTTPYKNFDILVTAENDAKTNTPSGQEVMRQHVER